MSKLEDRLAEMRALAKAIDDIGSGAESLVPPELMKAADMLRASADALDKCDMIKLADLRSRLWARHENAYCEMISVARRDESLGWEVKVEIGKFGRKELDSHCKAAELLGRHRAFAEACCEIDEVSKAAKLAEKGE